MPNGKAAHRCQHPTAAQNKNRCIKYTFENIWLVWQHTCVYESKQRCNTTTETCVTFWSRLRNTHTKNVPSQLSLSARHGPTFLRFHLRIGAGGKHVGVCHGMRDTVCAVILHVVYVLPAHYFHHAWRFCNIQPRRCYGCTWTTHPSRVLRESIFIWCTGCVMETSSSAVTEPVRAHVS